MYVSVRHVRSILHHTAGHITHVTLCSSQSRESADQLKLSGGARVQPPAARLSLKMGKPGSSPTNRQYRHADRQCMDWPLWTLCWPYGIRCQISSQPYPGALYFYFLVTYLLTLKFWHYHSQPPFRFLSRFIKLHIILCCVENKYLFYLKAMSKSM